jgi:fructosamine-3-kinase
MLDIDGFDITHIKRISASANATVYYFEADNQRYIAKVSTKHIVELEAYMLNFLQQNNLPVNSVVKVEDNILVSRYLENDNIITEDVEIEAAHILANLHSISANQYGFDIDTIIGPYKQYNEKSDSWIEFFASERVVKFAHDTFNSGSIPLNLYMRLEKFAENLNKYLYEPTKPSLLHGDIWSGNIIVNRGKLIGFIDPSVYFGHNEMELAFINMFDTFGNRFFKEYLSIKAIESDFHSREMIYNIYPNLVHARSFGGFYIDNINRTLKHFGY